jgi:hypothetical protein
MRWLTRSARNAWGLAFRSLGLVLFCCAMAHAQGGTPLTTVVTDQTPLSLSSQFGPPDQTTADKNGDVAFSGNGDSAIYVRPAGAASLTRLLQIDDPVPGIAGSQITSFSAGIYASNLGVLFGVGFDLPDGLPHAALLTYSWSTQAYTTVVTDTTVAPAPVSVPYGATLTPVGYNDNGDVAYTAAPIDPNVGAIILFMIPAGGPAERIFGVGDTAASPAAGPVHQFLSPLH